jgi:HtrA serine peptidase 2
VGSPLALSNTVTHGIISALDRRGVDLGMRSQSTFIQTDSAINQGNSGGPLLNLDGDVIGINSMKAAGVAGISFAIPINYAKDIVEQLRKHGRVLRPYIGIKMTTLTPDVVAFLKRRDRKFASSGVSEGVFVPEVADGSPAQRAGLKPNDIIVSINGRAVTSTDEVMDIIGKRIDQTLEIEVRRGPKSKFFSVKPTVGRPDAFLRD